MRNSPPLDRRRLLLACAALLAAGCGSSSAPSSRKRGQLLTYTAIGSVTAATLYKFDYATIDSLGAPITASALAAIPTPLPTGPRPLLCYFHGATTLRTDIPSNPANLEGSAVAQLFGADGYVVIAPDYPGLGDDTSGTLQSFEQATPLANMAIDCLLAVQTLTAKLSVALSGKLFLAGFSEGAYATMAAHRAIESQPGAIGPLTITASAPIAGAYDLSTTTLNAALAAPGPDTIAFVAGLLLAYNPVHHLFANTNDAFAAPYADTLPGLFDGSHAISDIAAALPSTVGALLTPSFLAGIQSDSASNPVISALRANDVYNWRNTAPIRLYHSPTDEEVPYQNAVVAQQTVTANGGNATLVPIGRNADHGTTPALAAPLILTYFNSL